MGQGGRRDGGAATKSESMAKAGKHPDPYFASWVFWSPSTPTATLSTLFALPYPPQILYLPPTHTDTGPPGPTANPTSLPDLRLFSATPMRCSVRASIWAA